MGKPKGRYSNFSITGYSCEGSVKNRSSYSRNINNVNINNWDKLVVSASKINKQAVMRSMQSINSAKKACSIKVSCNKFDGEI